MLTLAGVEVGSQCLVDDVIGRMISSLWRCILELIRCSSGPFEMLWLDSKCAFSLLGGSAVVYASNLILTAVVCLKSFSQPGT